MYSNLFAFVVAVITLVVNILAIPLARSRGYMQGLNDAMDVIIRAGDDSEVGRHESD